MPGLEYCSLYQVWRFISQDIPLGLCHDIYIFTEQFRTQLGDIEEILTSNRILNKDMHDMAFTGFFQQNIPPRNKGSQQL